MKENKKVNVKNQLELWLFCALIGAVAGALVWTLLKIMSVGIEFLWEWIPNRTQIPFYTVIVCTVGALIIGVFRKKYGDYPEELETVMGKIKTEKRYEYKNMLIMMIAALLPLLMGSSIGPEAGLTGIIVGLCYWVGDNLKFAKQNAKEYSQIGMAFLKILMTNLCIQFGLKGGHFFLVIFAGVSMGYGIAMIFCGTSGEHVVFAAAIVTASLLGGIMKKPLAVTMLLFLCFPVKMFVWIFVAAAAGSKLVRQERLVFMPDQKKNI